MLWGEYLLCPDVVKGGGGGGWSRGKGGSEGRTGVRVHRP